MTLERWLAIFFLLFFIAYGYGAYFTMDQHVPLVLQKNPMWPSSFPKLLSICGVIFSLSVIIGFEKTPAEVQKDNIDYHNLGKYHVRRALLFIVLMFAYALTLRPLGFILSTMLFVNLGSILLGERRYILLFIVSLLITLGVWYLVDKGLGIFLRPWPEFININ